MMCSVPDTKKKINNSSGFTLLELIIVLVIIFIFAALVAPQMISMAPPLRTQRVAEELVAMGRKARTDAARYGLHYRLNISDKSYWLTRQHDPFGNPDEWKSPAGPWADRTSFPEGVEVKSDQTQLEFHPDGTATEGKIVIENNNGDEIIIQIDPVTGKVWIENEAE